MQRDRPEELAEKVLAGQVPAVARAISWAESGDPRFVEFLRLIFPSTGKGRVVGLTGSPGAGKSTLTASLARLSRKRGRRVGIVAVDPSSPFTGGAILGDRIRMQDLYTDPDVLIRSMATRGNLGGLARATADAVDVLDAAGFDDILVETVGVGQDEVEVFRLAESCVVVLTPGMGDDIQAIKAGLMEVADLFVVNKSDRPGSDRVVQEILQMLELGEHGAWIPSVLKCVATTGAGVEELAAALESHRLFLEGPDGAVRRRARIRHRLEGIVKERLLSGLGALRSGEDSLGARVERVEARSEDPLTAAGALLAALRGEIKVDPGAKQATERESLVLRFAHLGIAVSSLAESGKFYDLLGLFETHREEVISQGVVTSFRPVGDSYFELLEPTSEESPIGRFLARKGAGLHHVCLEVRDIEAALRILKGAGVRLINENAIPGAHGCLVAFIHPAAAGGLLVELSQKHPGG